MAKKKQPRQRKVPLRTCVVCKEKQDKRTLYRVVRTPEQQIVVDLSGKQNGRGAYLCTKKSCWETAVSQPAILGRALKSSLSEEDLAQIVANQPSFSQGSLV